MSTADDLTGLLSRSAFLRRLDDGLAAATPGHSPLCLLLIDLDYLKSINDQYGHLAGDAALQVAAGVIRAVLRKDDVAGRYGGDEFVAFLPATTRDDGMAVAERLRAAMAAAPCMPRGAPAPLHLTLSIGVAAFPRDGTDATTLFAAADRGAYAAKAAGRDCVRAIPATDAAPSTPEPPSLGGGRLVGRQAELRRLSTMAEDACRGRGHFVVVEGEAGIGKTRLVEEIARIAHLLRLQVLIARCHQVEIASPYQPILAALTPLVAAAPLERLRQATGAWAGELARLFPVLRQRMPAVEPLPPLPPEEDRARLQQALCEFLGGVAQAPTLLVVDDLHWADEASIRVLNRLAWQIGDFPLLLISTLRTEDLPDNPPLSAALAALRRQGRCEQVALPPLSNAEACALLRTALGLRRAPDALQRRLIDGTGGNPLFLLETLRLLVERRVLRADEGHAHGGTAPDPEVGAAVAALPVATTVQNVIEGRLARLSAAQREIVAAAAVCGQRFDPDMLAALMSETQADRAAAEAAVWSAMETLEQQRLAIPPPDTAGAYDFAHPLIRQVAYQAVGAARRRALHRKIAALLDRGGAPPAEIAEHHWQGGNLARALELFVRAAEAATAIHAPRSAISYYERALAAAAALTPPHGATGRAALCERLGDLCDLDGDWHRALSTYREALAHGDEDVTARARLWCKIADLSARQGDYERALVAYATAAGPAGEAPLPAPLQATVLLGRARLLESRASYAEAARLAGAARALLATHAGGEPDLHFGTVEILGTIAHRQGDLIAAEAWFAGGLHDAEAGGAARWMAHFCRQVALIRWQRGDLEAGAQRLRQALALAESIGDQSLEASCRRNLGVLAAVRGRYAEAAGWYRRALEIFERSGDRQGAATIYHNLGHLAEVAGEFTAAEASFQQSLMIYEESGNRRGMAIALNSLGRVALDRGDFLAASHSIQRSLAINEEVGDPSPLGHCMYLLALAYLERGDAARSAQWRARVRALAGADPEDLLNNDLLEARALLLGGRTDEATAALGDVARRIGAVNMARLAVDACLLLAEATLRAAQSAAPPAGAGLLRQPGWAAAREATEHALARARREGGRMQIGKALRLLGEASARREEAYRQLHEALAEFHEMGAAVEAARTRVALATHPARCCDGEADLLLAEARATFQATGASGDLALLDERLSCMAPARPSA